MTTAIAIADNSDRQATRLWTTSLNGSAASPCRGSWSNPHPALATEADVARGRAAV